MSRRRLRICAAGALLALAAPIFAAQAGSATPADTSAQIKSEAQEFGRTVRQGSTEFSHRVVIGARQASRQFNVGMHQFSRSVQQWWDGVRAGASHARSATDERLRSI